MSISEELHTQASQWISTDPDPITRAELGALLEAAQTDPVAAADLSSRFQGPLVFGTAGLRAAVGAGQSRMNRAVVIRAAAGLAAFLTAQVNAPVVVIGYDARHGSADFAADSAQVLAAAGAVALLLPSPLPTPVLAYAVRALNADAGVMVTASHNPAADNGYKVYLGGRIVTGPGSGAQIVPPFDAQIAAQISNAPPANQVPRGATGLGAAVQTVPAKLVGEYLDRLHTSVQEWEQALAPVEPGAPNPAPSVAIVTTALHGVGGPLLAQALARAGFTNVTPTASQVEPDPDFPTVTFPNPEEAGALDEAYRSAEDVGASLVLAVDPDADRCSVAIRTAGGWRQLSGDDVGALLGAAALGGKSADQGEPPTLANSLVSSRLLKAIAETNGVRHRTTLTGFKWISRTPGLIFGYEEALGYCPDPGAVRDKDGIAASVRVALLAARLAAQGQSLEHALDELALRHGLHLSGPLTFRVQDLAAIPAALEGLRLDPPAELGGSPVLQAVDLREGFTDGESEVPPTEGLLYLTASGARVIIRPSGTEPKLKCYLEVIEQVRSRADLVAARERAQAGLEALRRDLSQRIAL